MGGPPSFPEELRRPSVDEVASRPVLGRLNTDETRASEESMGGEEGEGEIVIDVEADDASVYSSASGTPFLLIAGLP